MKDMFGGGIFGDDGVDALVAQNLSQNEISQGLADAYAQMIENATSGSDPYALGQSLEDSSLEYSGGDEPSNRIRG